MRRQFFYVTKAIFVGSLAILLFTNAGCDLGTYDKRVRSRNTTKPVESKADSATDGETAQGDSATAN